LSRHADAPFNQGGRRRDWDRQRQEVIKIAQRLSAFGTDQQMAVYDLAVYFVQLPVTFSVLHCDGVIPISE
jgi:hypothetical protein